MSTVDQFWFAVSIANVITGGILLFHGLRLASYVLGLLGYVVMLVGAFGIAQAIALLAR